MITGTDAAGAFENFILGGTSSGAVDDDKLPEASLFLNDTISGLLENYANSVLFIAQIEDESGINISSNNLGQDIVLTINDSTQLILNDFYQNSPDQYERGELRITIDNLPGGTNQFSLKYWDNAGNANTSKLVFLVDENSGIFNEIKNYPNPFKEQTNFYISHKLAGEDIKLKIDILNMNGQAITSLEESFFEANSELDIRWNNTNSNEPLLTPGVYIYQITLSSNSTGLTQNQRKKLVISY